MASRHPRIEALGDLPRIGHDKLKRHYQILEEAHDTHLKQHGVVMPAFQTRAGLYVQRSLALIALHLRMGKPVTKGELTNFVRKYNEGAEDIQDGRHLSNGDGWNVLSKQRGDEGTATWPRYSYGLISIDAPWPGWRNHRSGEVGDEAWNRLLISFDNRCSLCGSKQGESNLRSRSVRTELQRGHMDPTRPLTEDNCIPQCQQCNRPLQQTWIFDAKGRPKAIADPQAVLRSPDAVQLEMLEILRRKWKQQLLQDGE